MMQRTTFERELSQNQKNTIIM